MENFFSYFTDTQKCWKTEEYGCCYCTAKNNGVDESEGWRHTIFFISYFKKEKKAHEKLFFLFLTLILS